MFNQIIYMNTANENNYSSLPYQSKTVSLSNRESDICCGEEDKQRQLSVSSDNSQNPPNYEYPCSLLMRVKANRVSSFSPPNDEYADNILVRVKAYRVNRFGNDNPQGYILVRLKAHRVSPLRNIGYYQFLH